VCLFDPVPFSESDPVLDILIFFKVLLLMFSLSMRRSHLSGLCAVDIETRCLCTCTRRMDCCNLPRTIQYSLTQSHGPGTITSKREGAHTLLTPRKTLASAASFRSKYAIVILVIIRVDFKTAPSDLIPPMSSRHSFKVTYIYYDVHSM